MEQPTQAFVHTLESAALAYGSLSRQFRHGVALRAAAM